ncbi:hypothetical protein ACFQT0_31075 [Hymenobacter humi]|uniref:Uncharacterized protein n=1 Tax=Hymenobacter humi TaxID=1411620 RepID=A0ABW2UET6_9BACT
MQNDSDWLLEQVQSWATFYKYLHHRGVALHAQPLPSPVSSPAP